MIEIRELVIRANVGSSNENTRRGRENTETSPRQQQQGCCEENADLMLKIIKQKNER
jgi:hypothetical protein